MQLLKFILGAFSILPLSSISATPIDNAVASNGTVKVSGSTPAPCISFYTYVKKDFVNNLSTWELQAWDGNNKALCSDTITQTADWSPAVYTFPCLDNYSIRVTWNQSIDRSIAFDVRYPDYTSYHFVTTPGPIAQWYCCGSELSLIEA
jgi:hypothetical protein